VSETSKLTRTVGTDPAPQAQRSDAPLVVEADWTSEQEVNVYTAAQVAEKTGLSKSYVNKAVERKQLRGKWMGNQLVFTTAQINNWMANRRPPGRPKSK